MCFLAGYAGPTIAVLYQDSKQQRHLKTYTINTVKEQLDEGARWICLSGLYKRVFSRAPHGFKTNVDCAAHSSPLDTSHIFLTVLLLQRSSFVFLGRRSHSPHPTPKVAGSQSRLMKWLPIHTILLLKRYRLPSHESACKEQEKRNRFFFRAASTSFFEKQIFSV